MLYNPDIHHRKSIRLKEYDYSSEGLYFITICTHNGERMFGEIVGAHCMCPNLEFTIPKMILNQQGKIVENEILTTNQMRKNIEITHYVIMPNHIHFIIEIQNEITGHMQCAPTKEQFMKSTSNTIPTIVKLIKSSVTKQINNLRNSTDYKVWQRSYYENTIRNEDRYIKVIKYISGSYYSFHL